MRIETILPDRQPGDPFVFQWEEDFSIETLIINDGAIIIRANRAGLISLSNHLLGLAFHSDNGHIHLDSGNALENNSRELIIERV